MTLTEPAQSPARPRVRLRVRLIAAAVALVFAFGLAEGVLRLLTRTEADGSQWLFGVDLLPWRPPRRAADDATSSNMYDAWIGWAPRPLSTSPDGKYTYDQHGLRAPVAAPREIPPDRSIVYLAGDSFAHSDEVSWDEALGPAVESLIPGAWCAVAGVPGCGTDQSWWRYQQLKATVRPRVVLILVHQGDFRRNIGGWTRAGFSKPILQIRADGGLAVRNRPPLRGDAFQAAFDDFTASELGAAQQVTTARAYDWIWSDSFRALRFARSMSAHADRARRAAETSTPGSGDPAQTTTERIVKEFAAEVIRDGATPVVATAPGAIHISDLEGGTDWWSGPLSRAAAAAGCVYVDLTPLLLDDIRAGRATRATLFTAGGAGHFTAAGNRRVAELLAPTIRDAIAHR
ncbi:MAG: hypothetical protein K8T90_03995 [Planctomycetes bacterium]|nr:hypothetical protein [Planctomycetota bacterium]